MYAFPPINLIQRVLIKIRSDQVEEAIVVVPFWPRRPWFPLLLSMASDHPVRFQPEITLLSQRLQDKGILYHPDLLSLSLTAWRLNGARGNAPATVPQSSAQPWRPSGLQPAHYTMGGGRPTQAGAQSYGSIQFVHL